MLHEIYDIIKCDGPDKNPFYQDWTIVIGRGIRTGPGVGLNIQYNFGNKQHSTCVITEHPIILGLDLVRNGIMQMPYDLWRKITKKK